MEEMTKEEKREFDRWSFLLIGNFIIKFMNEEFLKKMNAISLGEGKVKAFTEEAKFDALVGLLTAGALVLYTDTKASGIGIMPVEDETKWKRVPWFEETFLGKYNEVKEAIGQD